MQIHYISKHWIAKCLYEKHQFDNAELMFREVEKMRKEVLGEKHEDTINSKYWIAKCLYKKQLFDNAELMFREVEKVRKEVLGMAHPK